MSGIKKRGIHENDESREFVQKKNRNEDQFEDPLRTFNNTNCCNGITDDNNNTIYCECPICKLNIPLFELLPCKHYMCGNCIAYYFRRNENCPTCMNFVSSVGCKNKYMSVYNFLSYRNDSKLNKTLEDLSEFTELLGSDMQDDARKDDIKGIVKEELIKIILQVRNDVQYYNQPSILKRMLNDIVTRVVEIFNYYGYEDEYGNKLTRCNRRIREIFAEYIHSVYRFASVNDLMQEESCTISGGFRKKNKKSRKKNRKSRRKSKSKRRN